MKTLLHVALLVLVVALPAGCRSVAQDPISGEYEISLAGAQLDLQDAHAAAQEFAPLVLELWPELEEDVNKLLGALKAMEATLARELLAGSGGELALGKPLHAALAVLDSLVEATAETGKSRSELRFAIATARILLRRLEPLLAPA